MSDPELEYERCDNIELLDRLCVELSRKSATSKVVKKIKCETRRNIEIKLDAKKLKDNIDFI